MRLGGDNKDIDLQETIDEAGGNLDKGHRMFMDKMKQRYFSTDNKADQKKRAILQKFRSGLTKNFKEAKIKSLILGDLHKEELKHKKRDKLMKQVDVLRKSDQFHFTKLCETRHVNMYKQNEKKEKSDTSSLSEDMPSDLDQAEEMF